MINFCPCGRGDTFANLCLVFKQIGGGQRTFLVFTSQLPLAQSNLCAREAYSATLQGQEQYTVAKHELRGAWILDNFHRLLHWPGGLMPDFLLLGENIPFDSAAMFTFLLLCN